MREESETARLQMCRRRGPGPSVSLGCQAASLVQGLGNMVAIGMELEAPFQKEICLEFMNSGSSARKKQSMSGAR